MQRPVYTCATSTQRSAPGADTDRRRRARWLYVAQLLRRAGTQQQATVLERNRANGIFRFGVVFSDGTLAAGDAGTVQALEDADVRWDAIEIRHAGELVREQGNSFVALPRAPMLGVLQRFAPDAGADAADMAIITGRVVPSAGWPSLTGRKWGS